MAFCVCGESARRLLENLSDDDRKLVRPVGEDDVAFETPQWREARALSFAIWGEHGLQADVLVRSKGKRKCWQNVRYHSWAGNVPSQSLALLPDGSLVTLPWFDLLMDASSLSMATISKRLMELTSVFRYTSSKHDDFVESTPLVTPDFLEQFVMQAKGCRGIAKVREALSWSPPRARSPREIDLTLALGMPNRLNGCGLPMSSLNKRQTLGSRARKMVGQDEVYIDLYWEALDDGHLNAGAEYLGKEWHKDIGKELTRVNALELEGIEIQLVTDEQLKDPKQLLMIAKRIAKSIGFTPFHGIWPSEDKLGNLVDDLLKVT